MPKQQVEPIQGSYTTDAGIPFAGERAYNHVTLDVVKNAALVVGVDGISLNGVDLYAGTDFEIAGSPDATLASLAGAINAHEVLSLVVAATAPEGGYTEMILRAVDLGVGGNDITLGRIGYRFVAWRAIFRGGIDAIAPGNAGVNCYVRGRDSGIGAASSDCAVVNSPDSYVSGASFSQILSGDGNTILSGSYNTISGSYASKIGGGSFNGIYNSENCSMYGDLNGGCTMIGCINSDYLNWANSDMMIGGYYNVNCSGYGWNIQMNAESCFLGPKTYGCAVFGYKNYVDAEYQVVCGKYAVANEQDNKKIFAGGSAGLKNQEGAVIGAAPAGGTVAVELTRNLPNNSLATHALMGFTVIMKAIQTGGSAGTVGDMAVRRYVGLVKMDSADTVTLVASSLDKNLGESAGAAAWGLTFAANAAGLVITTVGEADKVITFGVEVTTHELSV